MPNIKGISMSNKGDVSITNLDNTTLIKHRADMAKISEVDKGGADFSKADYDVYFHTYIDNKMKNPKRTVVLVTRKGNLPKKNWWVLHKPKLSRLIEVTRNG